MHTGSMRLTERLQDEKPVLIDGGLSTALEEMGHDLSDRLWSARLLADDPAAIGDAHAAFVDAGAEVVITASYQASIAGFVGHGMAETDAERLIGDATSIALTAVAGRAMVAASVGPYGAVLGDGSEYRGDYGLSVAQLRDWHSRRWQLLVDSKPDILAVETIPCLAEVEALIPLIEGSGIETWVCVSCGPSGNTSAGDDVADVARALRGVSNVVAVGVNCTRPPDVREAIEGLASSGLPMIAYPNLGRTWDPGARGWTGDSSEWLTGPLVDDWLAMGVRIIGGCCGTAPSDIRRLAARVRQVT